MHILDFCRCLCTKLNCFISIMKFVNSIQKSNGSPQHCRLCCRCSLPPLSRSTLCPRCPEREDCKQLERTDGVHDVGGNYIDLPLLLHSSPCCQKPGKESKVAVRLQEPTNFVTASSSSSNILFGSRTFHAKFCYPDFHVS